MFDADKPIKLGIKENMCYEGEIFENFDNVLKFFNKRNALKYIREYYKSKKNN